MLTPKRGLSPPNRPAAYATALHQLARAGRPLPPLHGIETQHTARAGDSMGPLPVDVPLLSEEYAERGDIPLPGVTWSPELLQSLSAAASQLPQLHVTLRCCENLDDALLDALMRHAPGVGGVAAGLVLLTDPRHGGTVRPWRELTVDAIGSALR